MVASATPLPRPLCDEKILRWAECRGPGHGPAPERREIDRARSGLRRAEWPGLLDRCDPEPIDHLAPPIVLAEAGTRIEGDFAEIELTPACHEVDPQVVQAGRQVRCEDSSVCQLRRGQKSWVERILGRIERGDARPVCPLVSVPRGCLT